MMKKKELEETKDMVLGVRCKPKEGPARSKHTSQFDHLFRSASGCWQNLRYGVGAWRVTTVCCCMVMVVKWVGVAPGMLTIYLVYFCYLVHSNSTRVYNQKRLRMKTEWLANFSIPSLSFYCPHTSSIKGRKIRSKNSLFTSCTIHLIDHNRQCGFIVWNYALG